MGHNSVKNRNYAGIEKNVKHRLSLSRNVNKRNYKKMLHKGENQIDNAIAQTQPIWVYTVNISQRFIVCMYAWD